MSKNRYFSFVHDQNPGEQTAVRVTFAEPPPEYWDDLKDQVLWVGEPVEITEASGSDGPEPPPKFWAATLQCGPFYTDWSAYDRVDVYDDAIIPGSTFDLDTILSAPECKVTEEYGFSAPTQISTVDLWGDVVGDCGVTPCTVPQGVVDFEDITAVVEKYSNDPDAPIKSRADLTNATLAYPTPDRKVDFVDITFCVEGFRGWPEGNPYPGPNLDDLDCPPYYGDCYADIRVDSNNDGEIDDFDDAIEETSTMFLVVNSDDDDDSGDPDFNEAPVVGEDDLAEIQLTAACDDVLPELAWWSLSWDPAAPIQIWRNEDKSGDVIENGVHYEYPDWPPPETLWLESLDTFDDLEITFTFDPGTGSLGWLLDPRQTKTDKAKTASKCSPPRNKIRRYHVGLERNRDDETDPPILGYNGIMAVIPTRTTSPLCNEQGIPHNTDMGSLVFVEVSRYESLGRDAFQIWVQYGYLASYTAGDKKGVVRSVYGEAVYGPNTANDRVYALPRPNPTYPPSGPNEYKIKRRGSTLAWESQFNDGNPWEFNHSIWSGKLAQFVGVYGEVLNKEDKLVGTETNRCRIEDIDVLTDWGAGWADFKSTTQNLVRDPDDSTSRANFGLEWISPDTVEIWDRIVP